MGTLRATPAAQLEHLVTVVVAEDRSGVDCAAVFRPNEIRGVKFEDLDGNHQKDPGEPGMPGSTVFLDLDRDDVLDASEPNTVTLADGSYAFTNLSPGAYVVRGIISPGYERTYPTTVGGILWPSGVSHPAVGNVSPQSITAAPAKDETLHQTVSLTLPGTGALTNLVDVFLLFDDTGSFVHNSPIVRAAFPEIIATLQTALPGIDLGFGVGRFEEYANFAYEYTTGRPFLLNQPIVAASTAGYMTAIQAALDRTTPGYGGDQPETVIEALYQVVTGSGFDGNDNGSVLDSGAAGLATTQLNPGGSGDVPSFASFLADPAASVMPAAATIGGGGFRPGALPIILTATDTGFAYQPQGETTISGAGGLTLPVSALTERSRPTTPFHAGAGLQQTATFDVEFVGDGIPHRFDLQFVRAGTNVVLGSIPVVLGTPIPGDGYEFEELEDGGIAVDDHFGDHVVAVNVAPSFTGGNDQTVPEDSSAQTVVGWATNISPGSPSESGQVVDFLVSNDNQGLFSVQPAISPDGTLTYAPAANANGIAG